MVTRAEFLQFEEEAPSQELTREAFLNYKEPSEAPATKEDTGAKPEWYEYQFDRAKKGLAAFMSLPGLPVDAVHDTYYAVKNLLGFDTSDYKPATYGAKSIQKAADRTFDMQNLQAPSEMQRYLGGVTEFTAGGIIPTTVAYRLAPTLTQKAATVASEVTSSLLGGVGMEVGRDVGGEAGAAIGSLASLAPLGFNKALEESVGRIRVLTSDETKQKIGTQRVAQLLKDELERFPDTVTNLERSEALKTNIPGFSPTLGSATDAPGVKSLEQRYAMESSATLAAQHDADMRSLVAIGNKFDELFPDAKLDITKFSPERLRSVQTALNNDLKDVQARIADLESSVTSGATIEPGVVGVELRKLKDEAQTVARGIKNVKYANAYEIAEKHGINVNTEGLYRIAENIVNDAGMEFQKKSPVLNEILTKYKAEVTEPQIIAPGTLRPYDTPKTVYKDIPVKEFHSLLRRLNREINSASKADDTVALYQLGRLKSPADDMWKNLEGEGFGDLSKALKDANDYWYNQYQSVFREGLGYYLSKATRGRLVTPNEKVVTELVLKREDGLDQFSKIYGDSPEAEEFLRNGVLDAFSRKVMKNGSFNPTVARTFLEKYRDVLRKRPEIQSTLEDNVTAIQALHNRQKLINERIKASDRLLVAQAAKISNVDKLISDSLRSIPETLTLRNTAIRTKGPQGLQAYRRSLGEFVQKQANPYQFVLDNEKTLRIGLGDSHYDNLKMIAEAKTIVGRQDRPSRIKTSLEARDPLEQYAGTSIRSLFSQARAAAQGRVSTEYVFSDVAGKYVFKAKQEHFDKLMEEALRDPEIAQWLAKHAGEDVKLDLTNIKKLEQYMYQIGAKANTAYSQLNTTELED